MEEQEKTPNNDLMCKVNKKVEESIENIIKDEITTENLKNLGMLVDIHKDLKNEEYWKLKEEKIMYGYDYGEEYREPYGRRGVPGTGRRRYRGADALEEMSYHYGNYQDGGSYGGKEDSAYKMIEAFKKFGYAVSEELEPKDKMMFKNAMKEMSQEMR